MGCAKGKPRVSLNQSLSTHPVPAAGGGFGGATPGEHPAWSRLRIGRCDLQVARHRPEQRPPGRCPAHRADVMSAGFRVGAGLADPPRSARKGGLHAQTVRGPWLCGLAAAQTSPLPTTTTWRASFGGERLRLVRSERPNSSSLYPRYSARHVLYTRRGEHRLSARAGPGLDQGDEPRRQPWPRHGRPTQPRAAAGHQPRPGDRPRPAHRPTDPERGTPDRGGGEVTSPSGADATPDPGQREGAAVRRAHSKVAAVCSRVILGTTPSFTARSTLIQRGARDSSTSRVPRLM